VGSTRIASRSGQFGALATVALWCASFALIKHLVDAGLAALESYAPRRMLGIALAFAGVVVVVVLGSGAHFSLHGLRGPLLVLVAPLAFALYNILYKPLLGRFDLPALTAAGGIAGSLLFLPFENTGAVHRFGQLGPGSWIALAALGLGATLGGYVTWSIALRGLEPSRAMSYLYFVPPLAVAIGAIALGESVTAWLVLGGALVIGGVAVAQRGPRRKEGMTPEPCVEARSGQPW
jgi:drug/metabolite transporter (DMT)-like permease